MNINKKVADVLYQTASLLEMDGADGHRVNAYKKAAHSVEFLSTDIVHALANKVKIAGVGESLGKAIQDILASPTFTFSTLEALKKKFPLSIFELQKVPGIGPKTALKLYKEQNIASLEDLQIAIEDGRITDDKLIANFKFAAKTSERRPIVEVLPIIEPIREKIAALPQVVRAEFTGSIRRFEETIGDADLLVATEDPQSVTEVFLKCGEATLVEGEKKARIIVDGLQIDLLVVHPNQWGAALNYFTGSKEFNIRLREIAKGKGLKINEYGIWDGQDKNLGSANELDLFRALNISFVSPELRTTPLLIDRALEKPLLTLKDIKGDFHVHSVYSDGELTIREIRDQAKKLGYNYVGIADHSAKGAVGQGMSKEKLIQQMAEIKRLNQEDTTFRILSAIECEVAMDGSLDMDDGILGDLDYVIAALHTQPGKNTTERMINAMQHPKVAMIAHPSGRLYGKRDEAEANWDIIFSQALKNDVFMEINGVPYRLDLSAALIREANKYGVQFTIASDAHSLQDMAEHMRYGVMMARKGFCSKENIVNTNESI